MKFGIRKPSIKRRIAARTSWKRAVRHRMGLKAPKGWGWLTNPKKAAYNRVYNRTTISADKLFKQRKGTKSGSCCCCALALAVLPVSLLAIVFTIIIL